jgi:hypothetical protein
MVLNKSAVKKMFNKQGVQVNLLALHHVDEWAKKAIEEMIQNAQLKNIKRVKPSNIETVCPLLLWEMSEND